MTSISLKAHRFILANAKSPVIYGSVDTHLVTFRLEDGSAWTFARREAAKLGDLNWAYRKVPHRGLIANRHEELKLLERLEREALLPSDLS